MFYILVNFCTLLMFLQRRFFRTIIRWQIWEYFFLGVDVHDFALFGIFEYFCDFFKGK